GIVRGLVEGRLGLGVGRQGQVLQVVRFLGHVFLSGGGIGNLARVLLGGLGLLGGGLLVLDDLLDLLGGILDRGERVLLGQFGGGDLLVELVLGGFERVERLGLRLLRGVQVGFPQVVLGLPLAGLSRLERLGHLGV